MVSFFLLLLISTLPLSASKKKKKGKKIKGILTKIDDELQDKECFPHAQELWTKKYIIYASNNTNSFLKYVSRYASNVKDKAMFCVCDEIKNKHKKHKNEI